MRIPLACLSFDVAACAGLLLHVYRDCGRQQDALRLRLERCCVRDYSAEACVGRGLVRVFVRQGQGICVPVASDVATRKRRRRLYARAQVGDELLCFGCSKQKPLESVEYTSEKLWLVRCYNGQLYGPSKASRTASKLHEGNRIKFVWDAAGSGDVSMFVNGALDGVVFTGIRNEELFPVVCNYGSVGEATLLSIEHGTAATAAVAAASGAVRFDSVRGAGVWACLVRLRWSCDGRVTKWARVCIHVCLCVCVCARARVCA